MNKRKITHGLSALILALVLIFGQPTTALALGPDDPPPVEVSNYEELAEAVLIAKEGDIITFTGVIEIEPNTDFNDMGKNLTLRRGNPTAFFYLRFSEDEVITYVSGFTFDGAEIESGRALIELYHSANFQGVSFVNCNSANSGGALEIGEANTVVNFTECIFENNKGVNGGHISASSGDVTIVDCTFKNGEAKYRGGAIFSRSNLTISRSNFIENYAEILGGAIAAEASLSIGTSKFYRNSADIEGGADIAADGTGLFKMKDNIETLTSIYASDGLVPLGWVYDYAERPMTFPTEVYRPQYVQLKMKFQDDTSPVDPDPIEPTPTEPEPTPDPEPNPTPTPTPEPDDDDDKPVRRPSGSDSSVTPPAATTAKAPLTSGKAVLDHTRTDYLLGYADGLMGQENAVTRAQMAQIIYRLLTPDSRTAIKSSATSFTDVSKGAWYYEAVCTLENAGIISGDGNGKFGPDQQITWGEMITMFKRFVDHKPSSRIITVHWARDAINTAIDFLWIDYNDQFKPDGHVTRSEMVEFAQGVFAWAKKQK